MAAKTVNALKRSSTCSRKLHGRHYLNAYVSSDHKPLESMVQGAIYVPLVEYEEWPGKPIDLARALAGNLASFQLEEPGTIARWLPGEKFEKDAPSEEEQQEKMDSWYLLHALMNLGRLAEMGEEGRRRRKSDTGKDSRLIGALKLEKRPPS